MTWPQEVVKVQTEGVSAHGTGFFVAPDRVMTALHNIFPNYKEEEGVQDELPAPRVGIHLRPTNAQPEPLWGELEWPPVHTITVQNEDVAIVRVGWQSQSWYPLGQWTEGSRGLIFGFKEPCSDPREIRCERSATPSQVQCQETESWSKHEWDGCSGAPVTHQGRVVAVLKEFVSMSCLKIVSMDDARNRPGFPKDLPAQVDSKASEWLIQWLAGFDPDGVRRAIGSARPDETLRKAVDCLLDENSDRRNAFLEFDLVQQLESIVFLLTQVRGSRARLGPLEIAVRGISEAALLLAGRRVDGCKTTQGVHSLETPYRSVVERAAAMLDDATTSWRNPTEAQLTGRMRLPLNPDAGDMLASNAEERSIERARLQIDAQTLDGFAVEQVVGGTGRRRFDEFNVAAAQRKRLTGRRFYFEATPQEWAAVVEDLARFARDLPEVHVFTRTPGVNLDGFDVECALRQIIQLTNELLEGFPRMPSASD